MQSAHKRRLQWNYVVYVPLKSEHLRSQNRQTVSLLNEEIISPCRSCLEFNCAALRKNCHCCGRIISPPFEGGYYTPVFVFGVIAV